MTPARRTGIDLLAFATLAAFVVGCGSAQRVSEPDGTATAALDSRAISGAWCPAVAEPAWLPILEENGGYFGWPYSEMAALRDGSSSASLPALPGQPRIVMLLDIDSDGKGELVVSYIVNETAGEPDESENSQPSSSVGVWLCGTEGWTEAVVATSVLRSEAGEILIRDPERTPGVAGSATITFQVDYSYGESYGALLELVREDDVIALLERGDLMQHVVGEGAPVYFGRQPLDVSGWYPRRDAAGYVWVALFSDYGWDVTDEYWEYERQQVEAIEQDLEATADVFPPPGMTLFRNLIVSATAESIDGSVNTLDPFDSPTYILLGEGAPPRGCDVSSGCYIFSDSDRALVTPTGFTWAMGVWTERSAAVTAADALSRDDVIVLANDEAIWNDLDAIDPDSMDDVLPEPTELHPRLRLGIPLETTGW